MSREEGTKAAYSNAMDQHNKSMLCHPTCSESKHMQRSPKKWDPQNTISNFPHVITWWVWNAQTLVTNEPPQKKTAQFLCSKETPPIHNKHHPLFPLLQVKFWNKEEQKLKSLPNSNPKNFLSRKGHKPPQMPTYTDNLNYKGAFWPTKVPTLNKQPLSLAYHNPSAIYTLSVWHQFQALYFLHNWFHGRAWESFCYA